MNETLNKILQKCRNENYPAIMGILNVTPDSFSDGGDFTDPEIAVNHAREMISQGADLIDIGAESTRPGSQAVSAADQIARLEPVLEKICRFGSPLSIDTTSSEVARFALDKGVSIINDVTAARGDGAILQLAAEYDCGLILMHMQGQPRTMQEAPYYDNCVDEVCQFLAERLSAAVAAGVKEENCIIDPGIGFGKMLVHNLELLANVEKLCKLGTTVMMAASRKRFISQICGDVPAKQRLGGSLAAIYQSYIDGARIFRVHDVAPSRQMLDVAAAIMPNKP